MNVKALDKLDSILLLGRFTLLHRGNIFALDFCRNLADKLWVAILDSDSDLAEQNMQYKEDMRFPQSLTSSKISYKRSLPDLNLRTAWLEEVYRPELMLSGNSLEEIVASLEMAPSAVAGSDEADRKLSELLACPFIPIDPMRDSIGLSSTKLLGDPLKHWSDIHAVSRTYFAGRVCVFGPESTGKSTLAKNLARRFDTLCAPEWARTMLASRNDVLEEDLLRTFALGHAACEDALARQTNRLLFCDTDALTTKIWSEWLYEGRCHPVVEELVDTRRYDLYLLTVPDVPWVSDLQRYLPEERQEFFERCRSELEKRDLPFVLIDGDWDYRLEKAVEAVSDFFSVEPQSDYSRSEFQELSS